MNLEGVILESKYAEFQHLIKGPRQDVWRDGYSVKEPKLLMLEFDRYSCEIDVMSQNQEWTDEDKEFVSRDLDRNLNNPQFRSMWVHETVKPGVPWPTYNDTDAEQIAVIAFATGTLAEALTYETRGRVEGPREEVVKELSERLNDAVEAEIVAS